MRTQQMPLIGTSIFLLAVAPFAMAMGSNYDTPEAASVNMPEELRWLVDREEWVAGQWVNWFDRNGYSGDTESLNKFLGEVAAVPEFFAIDKIFIHPGKGFYQAISAKPDERIEVDWHMEVTHCSSKGYSPEEQGIPNFRCRVIDRIDVYLGGQIEIEDLTVPDEFELVALRMPLEPTLESTAIHEFVDEHNTARAKATQGDE